jgi:hypothetical protein
MKTIDRSQIGSLALCVFLTLLFTAIFQAVASAAEQSLRIRNFENGETIRYPVALLLGTIEDKSETTVSIVNYWDDGCSSMAGIAHRGRFKALVELQPGKNELALSVGKAKLSWTLNYRPQTNPYLVRMVYFTDKSGKTDFQTPIANDPQDYRGKFDAALKIMQCFTAEAMNDNGYGRRTFNLETDENGRVITHVVQGDRSAEEYWDMDDGKMYELAAAAIGEQIPNPKAINLAVAAFTSFDPATKKNRAHTALGGGDLALFGGATIYTWPNSVSDVQRACMDATMTDVSQFASDSIDRNAYWANTSTCIGACLHELGHAFGLPHSADYNGIMVRGIDNFTRKFVFVDPPCAGSPQAVEFKDEDIGHWEPVSLAAMAPTRHFAMDEREWNEVDTIACEVDIKAGSLVVESKPGLRFVGVEAPGRADFYAPIDRRQPAPPRVAIPLADIARRAASKDAEVRVVDAEGHMKCLPVKELTSSLPPVDADALTTLLAGPFLRTWHFSKFTLAWNGPPSFAAVDNVKLKEIVESALQKSAVTSPENFVDFAARFPEDQRENVAGYAVRKFASDKARKVKILTGSDDGLRVWVNGRLVQSVSVGRDARADSESCNAELAEGENTLIAEVSQLNGGWGLYFRLQDEKGCDLTVTDDGRLVEWPSTGRAAE